MEVKSSPSNIDLDKVKEFFADDGPWREPKYGLEDSPVAALIRSTEVGREVYYYCALHPGFKNIHWSTIEHHIKYTPGLEHYEALTEKRL